MERMFQQERKVTGNTVTRRFIGGSTEVRKIY